MEKIRKTTNSDSSIEDVVSKIQFFSTNDENLKFLGEILSNDSSRNILSLLIENEMTAGEISSKANLSIPLVIHHLNKMIQSNIVTISKTSMNNKGQEMKHYKAKLGMMVLPENASKKAKKSKTLSNLLKKIIKFSCIGLVGIISGFVTDSVRVTYPKPTLPQYVDENLILVEMFWPLTISLSVIIIGLIIERIITNYKNKKLTC